MEDKLTFAEKRKALTFAAINPYVQVNIPEQVEKDTGRGYISCGDNNRYLEYLYSLYERVTLVKSCVDLSTDYVCGDEITGICPELFRNIARDYLIYGGYAINVLRNRLGQVAELHYIPFYRLRTNESNTQFWYSKDWAKSYGRVRTTIYPKFDNTASSIFYFNNRKNTKAYPVSPWSGAITAAELQLKINEFHLNALSNSFQSSYILSFNNGIPDDLMKEEIEDAIYEKFTGTENTGRILVNFAQDKEHSIEVNKLEVDDFGVKYEALKARSAEEILRAFKLNSRLIGDNSDSSGFTTTEFQDSFALYNRTVVRPIQMQLVSSLKEILPSAEIFIKPFSLNLNEY